MKKSTYIFIFLLFSVYFWHLSFIKIIINNDLILFMSWIWSAYGILYYNNQKLKLKLSLSKYNINTLYIYIGILISMFSAYYFRNQDFIVTFLSQRAIYSFVFLITLYRIQPTEYDIFKALKMISYSTIFIWIVSAISPDYIVSIKNDEILDRKSNFDGKDIGFNIEGYRYVTIYFYYIIYCLLKRYSNKYIIEAVALFTFILLFQNRSMLLGASIVLIYFVWKFKTKYKFFAYSMVAIVAIVTLYFSMDILYSLFQESSDQLGDTEYNRWKALDYYLYEYSPSWFCDIFGNGFPSAKTSFGKLMWANMDNGIYSSDLGMIGMWADFGMIPLIVIYSIVFSIILNKNQPIYLKFFALHLCLVPTIFNFNGGDGLVHIILLMYLYAYNLEIQKISSPFTSRRDNSMALRQVSL